jgi:hypothetical protein
MRCAMTFLCCIQCCLSFITVAYSQHDSGTNNLTQTSLDHATAHHSQSAGAQLRLYNGSVYVGYRFSFKNGQPYFKGQEAGTGTVLYDGILYRNVPMWYDLLSDKVIITHHDEVSQLSLVREKVAYFILHGHTFVYLRPDSLVNTRLTPGFYDLLYQGQVTLLARRINRLEQRTLPAGIERTLRLKVRYYIKRGGRYYAIKNQHALLQHLKDKKKELRQYIKQNKVEYGENQEHALVMMASYYDKLKK